MDCYRSYAIVSSIYCQIIVKQFRLIFKQKYSPTLAQMWQTMEASGNYSMPDMDLLRYSMPPATNNDYESWHRAVLNAQTQIEHQVNRLENLELLKSFGANAWRHHLVYLESEKKA